jgi:hypothetical protein
MTTRVTSFYHPPIVVIDGANAGEPTRLHAPDAVTIESMHTAPVRPQSLGMPGSTVRTAS